MVPIHPSTSELMVTSPERRAKRGLLLSASSYPHEDHNADRASTRRKSPKALMRSEPGPGHGFESELNVDAAALEWRGTQKNSKEEVVEWKDW